jgi:hypothetical protein
MERTPDKVVRTKKISRKTTPTKTPSSKKESNLVFKKQKPSRVSSTKKNPSQDPEEKSNESFEMVNDKLQRETFQIISDDVEINESMTKKFRERDNSFGTDYLVCGIIGTQSTGKSTLLNNMFDCIFVECNAKEGRGQTTRGIWGSFVDEKNILVLDIEGTDAMVRTKNDENAENKICLFGLLMSHVLFSKPIYYSNFVYVFNLLFFKKSNFD